MKLSDILSKIHAPKGLTTIISGVMVGDYSSLREQRAANKTLEQAEQELKEALDSMNNCKSDAAYWGYNGDVAYWKCVVNLLKASQITGEDNLPEVPIPDLKGGMVMDVQYKLEKFGEEVLKKAEKSHKNQT